MPRRRATQDQMVANWRRYAAELLGTMVLVFGGTTAVVGSLRADAPVLVVVPFAFGLALLAGLYAFAAAEPAVAEALREPTS